MRKLFNSLNLIHSPRRLNETKVELDGLRGVAVIIVFLGHILLFEPGFGAGIGSFGQVGVYLFFVLSAFLLTSITLNEFKIFKLHTVIRTFFLRRFLRIFPMYYFSLLLILISPTFQNMMFGGRDFNWTNHFFLKYPEGNYWAISVELEFYLVVPAVALLSLKLIKGWRAVPLCASFLLLGIFLSDWVKSVISFSPNYPHLLPYISIFLFGVLVAQIQHAFPSLLSQIPNFFWQILFLFGAGMYLFLIPRVGIGMLSAEGVYAQYYSTISGLGSSLILISALNGSGGFLRLLKFTFLRFIGIISFSIYLLHIFVMSYYAGEFYVQFGIYLTALLIFTLVVFLSTLTYLGIERPFMRLAHKYARSNLKRV
jgi:peptidoglycan/LPS O-acetylase OafA/YrhL